MSFHRISMVTLLLVVSSAAASPSFAAPRPKLPEVSAGPAKLSDACMFYKSQLDGAEAYADAHAGTEAAEEHSQQADQWWAAGVRQGCAWAK